MVGASNHRRHHLRLPRTRGLDEHVGKRGRGGGRRARAAVAACGAAGLAGADGEAAGRGVKGQAEAAGAGPAPGHGAAADRGGCLQQRAAWGGKRRAGVRVRVGGKGGVNRIVTLCHSRKAIDLALSGWATSGVFRMQDFTTLLPARIG
jgi:hypothetical protein